MSGWLEGRVALVTGGGSGIGRGIVERFVSEGARVGVLELVPEKADDLERALGEDVVVTRGDVTDYEASARAVAETVRAFGKLDVVCANAGIYDFNVPLVEIEPERLGRAFDELYAVNVKGALYTAKAAIPELLKTEGTIIFTCSFASYYPAGGGILYTPSKHAVLGMVKELAYELAPKIRVNGVAPGAAVTTMLGVGALDQEPQSSLLPGNEKFLPIHYLPYGEDYAGCFVFLASKENSRVMTGSVINAYNGLDIRGTSSLVGGLDL